MNTLGSQRFLKFVCEKDFSHFPAAPLIVGDHAAHISGIPLGKVCRDGRKLASALITAYQTYQHDLLIVFSDVTLEAEALGTKLDFSENEPPLISGYPDLKKTEPANPQRDGRMPEILLAAEECSREIGHQVPVAVGIKDPFSVAAQLQNPQDFYKNCLKDPTGVKKILEITTENQLRFLDHIIAIGALPLVGAPFCSGSLISPDLFRELAAPGFKKLFDPIRASGLPVLLHICGDSHTLVDPIMELMPDVLSVDQIDLQNVVRRFPATLFMGNLSTDRLLFSGAAEIYQQTAKLIHEVRFPFLPSTGCDVPMRTPAENVKAMIQAIRDCGGPQNFTINPRQRTDG